MSSYYKEKLHNTVKEKPWKKIVENVSRQPGLPPPDGYRVGLDKLASYVLAKPFDVESNLDTIEDHFKAQTPICQPVRQLFV